MKHAFRFAWAPVAVLILLAVLEPTLGSRADPYLHLLGGAACQYYFYNVLSLDWLWIGTLTRFAKMIFAFTSTATIATSWELGEFISDKYFGTHLQESIPETIEDLALGLLGAIIVLIGTLALKHYENRTASSNSDTAERAI